MDQARFYVRVIELSDGGYECRRGRADIDRHETAEAAIEHAMVVARVSAPSAVLVHRLDGGIEYLAIFD